MHLIKMFTNPSLLKCFNYVLNNHRLNVSREFIKMSDYSSGKERNDQLAYRIIL